MPSLASGNMSCTAWASTCAAECRMTLRPSSVSAATGVTSTSASGAQDRSRSRPSASRTTTIGVGGAPARQPGVADRRPGGGPGSDPDRGCWGGAGGRRSSVTLQTFGDTGGVRVGTERDHAIGAGGHVPEANRALQPLVLDADELRGPAERAEQPQRRRPRRPR